MARPRAYLVPCAGLSFVLLFACPPAARAQLLDPAGRSAYGLRAGLLWLHAVDEAASSLRYGGIDRPIEVFARRDGPAGGWDVALELRKAALDRMSGGAGAADDRRVAFSAGWSRRALGSAGSRLALRVGVGAQAQLLVRDQRYPGETRRFATSLLALGPRAALEHTRGRDAYAVALELPVLALAERAYGATVQAPWRLSAIGRDLRGGRLALDWWHALGPRWLGQIGCRAEGLRLGPAPSQAEAARGVVIGLAYQPGRRP